jgi:hypothetical protein
MSNRPTKPDHPGRDHPKKGGDLKDEGPCTHQLGPAIKYQGDNFISVGWVLGRGDRRWWTNAYCWFVDRDNRHEKQRPNLPNSATIALNIAFSYKIFNLKSYLLPY